ncbi:MAG: efflux RND transporter permease subunit [Gammaproteobacteria bacterium]|nr:efflux RND transporter permease subunit [Gammaproteobacteria bacterium]MBU1653520.1 efflux RND transporter permease subunit [Gammaproteobacteria bacterium]MBU1962549.1 efflux RND transporter permease subunit [Gammaproteobacteria bacterium]
MMAKAFIKSPLSPLLLALSLAIGILGLFFTPRQEDPQISVPMVDIFVRMPGSSSETVAHLVADPLERIMSEIHGVKHVYSVSQRDQAMVTVQFDVGEAMEPSLVKLYDKLQSNMDRIPPGASPPLVKPKGVDDVPVVTLTLWSNEVEDSTLKLIGLDVLQHLKEIPNTANNFIVHGRSEQMRVEPLPERLYGYGIGLDQIAGAIRAANGQVTTGSLESGDKSFQVRTGNLLTSPEDLGNLMVGVRDNMPVYLRDLAKITLGPCEAKSLVNYYSGPAYSSGLSQGERVNGAPAVTLAIAKKPGSNGVSVANDVLAMIEEMKGRVIPGNVRVEISRNYGKTANDKVNELIFKLFVATFAVTLLIWLLLGWRAAVVVLVVIPVVILVTVFCAWVLGFTIDRVSLFALIFSIGILVDDAIVVVENVYRRWLLKNDTDVPTTVDAVREVGNPTILATFTVIAALLPMGFVSGMMGPYMAPIPALGSVAMVFSLFAAFIFTPWLTLKLKPGMAALAVAADKEHAQNKKIGNFFRRLILPLIFNKTKGRWLLLGIIGAFFLSCVLFYTQSVRVKMLPLDNKPEYNVVIDLPEGTALPVTANLTRDMAERLREIPEVVALQSYVGTASPFNFNGLVRHYYLRGQPWQADIQIQLTDKHERNRSSHQIALETRDLLEPMARAAGANIQVVEMPPGPPVLQSVVAEVYGPDAESRRQFARDLTAMFRKAEHLADVDNYLQADREQWRFRINMDKAQRAGVAVESINRTLEMAMGYYKAGDIKHNTTLEPTLIILQLPFEVRSDIGRLSQLPVPSSAGAMVPLTELGVFERVIEDKPIFHKDLRAVEFVTAETTGRLAAPIYGMLEVGRLLDNYTAPDGVKVAGEYLGPPKSSARSGFEWGGEWTVTYETFRDMGAAFAVALVLIYMLVVWEFGNFVLPGIIMAPIPLTLIGIIPGHWLMDAEFTATSMIGFIALAGIIVRNSILLVDFSRQEVNKGVHVLEALLKACEARTRPIVITALALVLGSSVILFDPIFQGMAISLLFGVVVSTLLTLVVIPLGCISGRAAFCPASLDLDEKNFYSEGCIDPEALEKDRSRLAAGLEDFKGKGSLRQAAGMAGLILGALWHEFTGSLAALARTLSLAIKPRPMSTKPAPVPEAPTADLEVADSGDTPESDDTPNSHPVRQGKTRRGIRLKDEDNNP